ncbi:MAG: MBL fold metallo-hydrolase [Patescibacteria group bacterium]
MRIGFFGAANGVTGSCSLVETSAGNLLVDCGLFQENRLCSRANYEAFGFDPHSIGAVCITHAHVDHHGRLPRLFSQGAHAPIYSTAPTRDLSELILEDAYGIMLEEVERCHLEPMYAEEDVENVMRQWHSVPYRDAVEVLPGVRVTFFNSGHILGSAFVLIEADGKRVVMSGDVGNDDVPILPPTDALPRKLDLVVCESTYGDRLHSPTKDRLAKLKTFVTRVVGRGGVLMIPAFSVERTQELLFDLNLLVERDGVTLDRVYLDSPLGIGATHLYEKYREELDLKFPKGFVDDNFFQFRGLNITETVSESKAINNAPSPKVIIAGAGMMNAGRIQHHLLRSLDNPKNGLLIIGYLAEGTLGREIQDGKSPVHIMDYAVDVRCEIEKIDSYSAHADYDKLTRWLKDASPKRVALTHGDAEAKRAFSAHLERQGVGRPDVPAQGEWITIQ